MIYYEEGKLTFDESELETIKDLISDWGFEYSLRADTEKVQALAKKLGVRGPND